MMHRRGLNLVGVIALLCLLGWAAEAGAVYIDDQRTLEVVGKAQTRTWDDPERGKRYFHEVVAYDVLLLPGPRREREEAAPPPPQPPEEQPVDDIPF